MNINTYCKKFADEVGVMKHACCLVKELSPGYLEFSLLRAFLNAVAPYIAICMSALIIDELAGNKNMSVLLIYVLISVGGTACVTTISSFLTKKISVLDATYIPKIKNYLNNRIYSADYALTENHEYTEAHADIVKIMFLTNGGMAAVIRLFTDLTHNLLSLLLALIILFTSSFSINTMDTGVKTSSFLFFLLTLAVVIFTVFLSVRNSKTVSEKQYNLAQNVSTNSYLDYYHFNYMEDDKAGKDIRIFDQRKLIISEVIAKGRIPWLNVLLGRYSLYQKYLGANILISTIVGDYAYIYVGLQALAGYISLGSVTKSCVSITMLISALSNVFEALAKIQSNNQYLRLFFEFTDIPVKEHNGKQIPENDIDKWEIEFHNVSFRYPNSRRYAVKNMSLKISSKYRIAIVGMNGSGKTTMIKLLCGLYRPEEGYITLNGIDIREYDNDEYLKLFTVVFQDFKLFSLPVGENIAASRDYDDVKARQSLKVAGVDGFIRKLPLQLQQYVYKYIDEDGAEPSGGEEQKLAIARAHYKNTSFIILDEPTAALDPVAEYDIYNRLNEIIDNKAAIFISHRLSSCKFCSTILVFDQGEIIQMGNHDTLLKDLNGRYYELWNAQAQYYQ